MIKEAPYYWVVCDDCGRSSQEGHEFDALGEKAGALEVADDADWFLGDPGPHYCEACSVKRIVCTDCFKEIAETTDEARDSGWQLDPIEDAWVGPKCALTEIAGQEALEVRP